MVQQLLMLARQEPDAAMPGSAGRVQLVELDRQAVADLAPFAEARHIDLGAARIDEHAVVAGETAALRTLLANLVDNAIRYTPSGGRVDVSAGVLDDRPYLEVADTGPGIPVADRERVFDRFYRRDGTTEPGTGLGLAIAKAIADRHRAQVTMGDAPEGGLLVHVAFSPEGDSPKGPPQPGRPALSRP